MIKSRVDRLGPAAWLTLPIWLVSLGLLSSCETSPGPEFLDRDRAQVFSRLFAFPLTANERESASALLAQAGSWLDEFERNDLRNYRGFATGLRFFFMPSPGEPRVGSRGGLLIPDSQAVYLEISPMDGSAGTLTINEDYALQLSDEQLGEHGSPQSPWISVNAFVLDGDVHLCFFISCTKVGKGQSVNLRWTSAGGYVANVQRYAGMKW